MFATSIRLEVLLSMSPVTQQLDGFWERQKQRRERRKAGEIAPLLMLRTLLAWKAALDADALRHESHPRRRPRTRRL